MKQEKREMDENSDEAIRAMIDELKRHIPEERVTTEHAGHLLLQIYRYYGRNAKRATEAMRRGDVRFRELKVH
jgi:hypothetical protein